ncbi:MAG: helix-turn-helix domain-containing protein [Actinomycetota bacterium]
MKQHTDTGIGRALRSAREHRGKSLEEAGRETRVRTDYLEALENEAFEALGSDVYVRGFLRSYAKYLGLNHEKVVSAYERVYGRPKPSPAPVERAPTVTPTEALVLTEKKRPSWLLAAAAAIVVLSAAAAIGLIGGEEGAPPQAEVTVAPAAPVSDRTVAVGIEAYVDTTATSTPDFTVVVDGGEPESFDLEEGDQRSFEGTDTIELSASRGGTFLLVVNGNKIPLVGQPDTTYKQIFTPTSNLEEGSTPSPSR